LGWRFDYIHLTLQRPSQSCCAAPAAQLDGDDAYCPLRWNVGVSHSLSMPAGSVSRSVRMGSGGCEA
jgi:hypothetical protein